MPPLRVIKRDRGGFFWLKKETFMSEVDLEYISESEIDDADIDTLFQACNDDKEDDLEYIEI
jgi:hypothetical protein